MKLGAINSINWARVLAQITYYFYSWLRVTDVTKSKERANFAVPTGNFGDILAGYYAKLMGLPVGKLVICTNENDVLHRFLRDGVYSRRPSHLTIAPSMDISVSSNFERYLFYLANRQASTVASWMKAFESTGELAFPTYLVEQARTEFGSYSSSRDDIVRTMRTTFVAENYLLCPHTATAVHAVKSLGLPARTTVCLATAHPAKFEEAISLALAEAEVPHPPRPPELEALFSLPTRTQALPNDLGAVERFVKSKLRRAPVVASSAVSVGIAAAFIGVGALLFMAIARRGRH